MTTFKPFILAGLFVCLNFVSALAGDPGFYAGVNAGLVVPTDVELSYPGFSGDVSRKVGYSIGGAAGYDFGTNVRAEAEISYKSNDTNELKNSGTSTGLNATITALNFMANAYYDFRSQHSFGVMPYLGAGVGMSRLSTNNAVGTIMLDSDDTVFAYQAIAGLAFEASSNVTMDVGYRYFRTTDAKFTGNPGLVTMKYDSHNILAGLRFRF